MTLTEAVELLFPDTPLEITPDSIQKAFRKRVKEVHPDLNPQSLYTRGLDSLIDARQLLDRWYTPEGGTGSGSSVGSPGDPYSPGPRPQAPFAGSRAGSPRASMDAKKTKDTTDAPGTGTGTAAPPKNPASRGRDKKRRSPVGAASTYRRPRTAAPGTSRTAADTPGPATMHPAGGTVRGGWVLYRADQRFLWIPRRPLRFGQFLYYCRVISWDNLIGALLEQRRERVNFGTTAVDLGLLSSTGVQTLGRHLRPGIFIGVTAQNLGLLTTRDVQKVLAVQRSRSRSFGQILVDRGLLTQEERVLFLTKLRIHNQSLHTPNPGHH